MLVYRIALAKYASSLVASGRAARWNPNDVEVIYVASSRSQACLENVVHRSQKGLSELFNVMTIALPEKLTISKVDVGDLPEDWKLFEQQPLTQAIGAGWVSEKESLVLEVPSAIIVGEINYLINPAHPEFSKVKFLKSEPFIFDPRIKS